MTTVYEIPLKTTPAQAFSFIVDTTEFYIRLKTMGSTLYMDFSLNGVTIFEGLRCDSGVNLLKLFEYKGVTGVLFFLTKDGLPPNWQRLGTEDKLYYATV